MLLTTSATTLRIGVPASENDQLQLGLLTTIMYDVFVEMRFCEAWRGA